MKKKITFSIITPVLNSDRFIKKTLLSLYEEFGNRKVFIAREMTKIFEEYTYSDLKTISMSVEPMKAKGEYVFIVAKAGYKDE